MFNTSKIQFKSNSQLIGVPPSLRLSCVQYLKDTIQKQFTTLKLHLTPKEKLCSIPQRYNSKAIHNFAFSVHRPVVVVFNTSKIQFKSNSQPPTRAIDSPLSCVQYLKDTIQKQFTTFRVHTPIFSCCVQYLKDTIQKQFTTNYQNG